MINRTFYQFTNLNFIEVDLDRANSYYQALVDNITNPLLESPDLLRQKCLLGAYLHRRNAHLGRHCIRERLILNRLRST